MENVFTCLRKSTYILPMLISLYGCTTTENDETIAVYDNPSATKLTNAEITNLVVGNVVSYTKWSGVASYYKNGSYQYSQGGKTYNSTYRIENDQVCIYKESGDQILCAEYYRLDDQYHWSNTKNRKWTSIATNIIAIDG